MKNIIICILMLPWLSAAAATHYSNGKWWDGEAFQEQDWYVVEGLLTQNQPDNVSETVDLEGNYVVPPFAEAHNHNLQNPWLAENFHKSYVDAGILYGVMMCGAPQTRQATRDVLSQTPLNIKLVSACVTSSDGHPVRMALQPQYEGGPTPEPEDIYDSSIIIIDDVDDISEKWPLIAEAKTDLVKIILVHHEDEQRRGNDEYFGVNGLTPDVVHQLVPFLQEQGLRVVAHVESAPDFSVAVEAGVDIIAHLPGYDWWAGHEEASYRLSDDIVSQAAEKGTFVIATASASELFPNRSEEQATRLRTLQKENLTRLHEAGVPLIMGSDRFDANVLAEYRYLDNLGIFTATELLNMLTRDTSRAIFPKRRIGAFEEGYEASFLVLNDNPLVNSAALEAPLRVISAEVEHNETSGDATPSEPELARVVTELDTAVFDSFNRCSDPEQLARHASFFAHDVEFYHDNGGVTWNRDEMLARTRDNACGNYKRELIEQTFEVYPVNGFGAIAQGTHRFCESTSDTCDGLADFTMVWREQEGQWQVTRVLSYGHRASDAAP